MNWAAFLQAVHELQPKTLIVLGSGLSVVASKLRSIQAINFGDIPGLVPTTVLGHKGVLSLGHWNGTPVLMSQGRVHAYEGHPLERVTRMVNIAADLGMDRVILTNAAGGIRPDLQPGSLMPIQGHFTLLNSTDWKNLGLRNIYDVSWCRASDTTPGIYAALTGPCYETPAEIRALRSLGADAVGMSTAREAEAALARGLKVIGLSCITNLAAGLAPGTLSHADVEINAQMAVRKLGELLDRIIFLNP